MAAASTPAARRATKAATVSTSNLRDRPEPRRQVQALRANQLHGRPERGRGDGRPSTSTRSWKPLMCGER